MPHSCPPSKSSRFISSVYLLAWLLIVVTPLMGQQIETYFAPNGGFNSINRARKIELPDGRLVDATLDNALLDLIERTGRGGTIKICTYAFSRWEILDALIKAARERQITVKLLLDAVAQWTAEQRAKLIKIVAQARQAAPAQANFNFQIKQVTPEIMVQKHRSLTLSDGTVIYGTMHEKFGVFYDPHNPIPMHAFCGSSNISYGADQIFAENRFIFKNCPAVARQLAEEFARLWNEYAVPVTAGCISEKLVSVTPDDTTVKIVFNSEPRNEEKFYRIDEELIKLMKSVWWKGTIDIGLFSFTHKDLAMTLLQLAKTKPHIRIRILMDQTQMQATDEHSGLMGPYLEEQIAQQGLQNFQIRYKWRSNAFTWDPEKKQPHLSHWRNLLLHWKLLIVNRRLMATGSYNWSISAEKRNFENMMFFNAAHVGQKPLILAFAREFDTLWERLRTDKPVVDHPLQHPQVITGPVGRALTPKILAALNNPLRVKLMALVEHTRGAGISLAQLATKMQMSTAQLQPELDILFQATLLGKRQQGDQTYYFLAD